MHRQDNERKIRPWRLGSDPLGQGTDIANPGRLLGDDRGIGAALDLVDKIGHVDTDRGLQLGIAQDALGNGGIAPARCQDQGAFEGFWLPLSHRRPCNSGALGPI